MSNKVNLNQSHSDDLLTDLLFVNLLQIDRLIWIGLNVSGKSKKVENGGLERGIQVWVVWVELAEEGDAVGGFGLVRVEGVQGVQDGIADAKVSGDECVQGESVDGKAQVAQHVSDEEGSESRKAWNDTSCDVEKSTKAKEGEVGHGHLLSCRQLGRVVVTALPAEEWGVAIEGHVGTIVGLVEIGAEQKQVYNGNFEHVDHAR